MSRPDISALREYLNPEMKSRSMGIKRPKSKPIRAWTDSEMAAYEERVGRSAQNNVPPTR
jgi:hypothetical protein